MAFISDDTLQTFSYAGPEFHAPQIFRQEIFAKEHLTAGFGLEGYLFCLTDDYLVIFPAFFLRFNDDGTISFIDDRVIREHRRNIFGIPMYLVSDIAADDAEPLIRTGALNRGRVLSGQDAPRIRVGVPEEIPPLAPGEDGLSRVRLSVAGSLFTFSPEDLEKYNRCLYGTDDYLSTLDHFNHCLFLYQRELQELVEQDTLFPVREMRKRRNTRREAVSAELTRLSRQIFSLENELGEAGFSLSPLRIRERRLLKQRIENLKARHREKLDQYQCL